MKRAAKARLENAADRMAAQLLGMAEDTSVPPAVKLAAIKDALDRAGLSPAQALQVTHELKPYEQILDSVHRGPRPGAIQATADVVDAEVVENTACQGCGLDFTKYDAPPGGYPTHCRKCREAVGAGREPTPRRANREPRGSATGPARTPREGLMTAEDAASRAAEGQVRARTRPSRS